MRLKIMQTGEPVLRESARLLTPPEIVSEEIQRLIREMRETMRDAPGVGLAAPQVGLPLQLAVIEDREDLLKGLSAEDLAERERRPVPFHVVINPVIAYSSDEKRNFYEGCLSLPGFSAVVPTRPHHPRRISRRTRRTPIRPGLRLVRPHPPTRNRSSPRLSLHRPHAIPHLHHPRQLDPPPQRQTHPAI